MTLRTLFEIEDERTRSDAASALRGLAAQLDGSGSVSFESEETGAVSVVPSESLDFELSVEREGESEPYEFEIEVELEWYADQEGVSTGGFEERDEETVPEDDDAAVPAGEMLHSQATFEVFEDRAGEWRWRLVHRNGNVIATSGEGYTQRHNAEKGLRSVVQNAPGADVVDE